MSLLEFLKDNTPTPVNECAQCGQEMFKGVTLIDYESDDGGPLDKWVCDKGHIKYVEVK